MATIDWPTDRAFMPADFSVGADVPLAQWRAPNTGTREVYSRAADRMTCQLSLPPCKRDDAARIESFLAGLLSTGDNVRFPMFHRRTPRGTLGGSPTVNGAVAAGARTLNLQAAVSRPNLLGGSSFEIDTNADGVADGLTTYSLGSPTGVVYSIVTPGNGTTNAQNIVASSLPVGSRVGFRFASLPVNGATVVTLSIDGLGSSDGAQAAVYVQDGVLSSQNTVAFPAGVWTRVSVTHVLSPSATGIEAFVWVQRPSGSAAIAARFDNVQLEVASAATAYAGAPTLRGGDFFAVGGNLLQVAYAGATLNDAGAGAVPLAYPVQKAISTGAAVTWDSPTGVWQLDTAGITFDYSPGVIMNGLVLPFRQVVV